MDTKRATELATAWASAWNAHDLDEILSHFADDIVFTSPVAAQLVAGSNGVIEGKQALRHYWEQGLRLIPDLHFEVVGVYVGVNVMVINYRNQKGQLGQRSPCLRRRPGALGARHLPGY
jgi:ketosteroid isomerase-like protein